MARFRSGEKSPSEASWRRSRSSRASSSPTPTARISSAVRANEPRLALKSGRARMTTLAPSAGGGSAASNTSREQMTRTDTAATGSRRVRNTAPPRTASSAICPSTQTRPSRLIHPPTSCSTVRTGTGASADVSSGTKPLPLAWRSGARTWSAHRPGRRAPARTPRAAGPARRRGCAAGRGAMPPTVRRNWAAVPRPQARRQPARSGRQPARQRQPARRRQRGSAAAGSDAATGSASSAARVAPPGDGLAEAVRLVAEQPHVACLVEVPAALPLGRLRRRLARGFRRGRLGRRAPGRDRLRRGGLGRSRLGWGLRGNRLVGRRPGGGTPGSGRTARP